MTTKRTLFLISLILLLLLSGCGSGLLRFNGAGFVSYYDSPTPEFRKPDAALTRELSARQIRAVSGVIRSIPEWNDDKAVNRAPFTFDGELRLYDTTYYFSYDSGIIYYNHFYGRITPEQAARIRGLDV